MKAMKYVDWALIALFCVQSGNNELDVRKMMKICDFYSINYTYLATPPKRSIQSSIHPMLFPPSSTFGLSFAAARGGESANAAAASAVG